jgi:hypothetical protein
MPFADVLNRTRRQDRIAKYCGVDLPVALVAGFLASKDLGRKSLRRLAAQTQPPVPDPKFIPFQEVKVVASSEHLPKAAGQKQAS